jgi:hypothetical protein
VTLAALPLKASDIPEDLDMDVMAVLFPFTEKGQELNKWTGGKPPKNIN